MRLVKKPQWMGITFFVVLKIYIIFSFPLGITKIKRDIVFAASLYL